jgi:predicted nucleic acid-binding protein
LIRIVDSSVACKWFTAEDGHREAQRLLSEPDVLVAPSLLLFEVSNVFWKKQRRGEMDEDTVKEAIDRLRRSETLELVGPRALIGRAMSIAVALGHPAYDSFYIACAELFGARCVTAGKRMLKTVAGRPFAQLVEPLD